QRAFGGVFEHVHDRERALEPAHHAERVGGRGQRRTRIGRLRRGDRDRGERSRYDNCEGPIRHRPTPAQRYWPPAWPVSVLRTSNLRPSGNTSVTRSPVGEPLRLGLITNVNVPPIWKLLLLSMPTRRNPTTPSDS